MPRSNRNASRKRARVNRAGGRQAFDSAPVGLALIGPEGRFLHVNPRLCRLLGYAEKQLLRSTLWAVTDPHDLEPLAGHCHRLLAGEVDEFRLEQRFLRADGRPAWGQISATLATGVRDRSLTCVVQIDEGFERGLSGLS